MTFTASPTFAGAAAVSYTLSNAFAVSAPGSVAVTVTARRDVSTDHEVTGLLSAQADSARRFASAQISNFTRRLKACTATAGPLQLRISLMPPPPADNQRGSGATPWLSDDTDRLTGSPLQPFIARWAGGRRLAAGRDVAPMAAMAQLTVPDQAAPMGRCWRKTIHALPSTACRTCQTNRTIRNRRCRCG